MRNIFVLLLLMPSISISAQELNCKVKIITPKLQIADPSTFQTLEASIAEFMNNRKWTDDVFQSEERINCQLTITISDELSADKFIGQATIQSSRPVHNSNYETVVFNHSDKEWEITYRQYEPLEFNENAHLSNITSLLAYYAYIIIGLDYDSYSKNGGQPYLLKAQNIVVNASSVSEKGWKSFENNRNRYWLVTELLNNRYEAFRSALYTYHIGGLDHMYPNRVQATSQITKSLELLESIHKNYPNTMILTVFFLSKRDELVNIYQGAPPAEKVKAINLLKRMDPTNTEFYNEILK